MKIRIHELAAHELDEAIEWHELQSRDLGKHFRRIVREQVKTLARNPIWYLRKSDDIYKAFIPKFPYKNIVHRRRK